MHKVLYVDDEQINLDLFRINFMNIFEVYTAKSGKEGVAILHDNPGVNVIVTDLKMPGMDGMEFISLIKENNPELVCIMLTGFMESEVKRDDFQQDLVFSYILKPWKKNDLRGIIESAFKNLETTK